MRMDGGVIFLFPTYLAWGVIAATLCAAGVWYWKTGYRSPQRWRRGVGVLVGVIFAVNGFVNSVWLGVYREGSLEAALSPLGWGDRDRHVPSHVRDRPACVLAGCSRSQAHEGTDRKSTRLNSSH